MELHDMGDMDAKSATDFHQAYQATEARAASSPPCSKLRRQASCGEEGLKGRT